MRVDEFILARVAEEEAIANTEQPRPELRTNTWTRTALRAIVEEHKLEDEHLASNVRDEDNRGFGCDICHSDEATVCPWGECVTLLALARIWSDHLDFDPSWLDD